MDIDSTLLPDLLRETIAKMVARNGPDLSLRQLSVLLVVHRIKDPHTIRDLATRLRISKQAITHSVNRLEEYGMVRRRIDRTDQRSINVLPSKRGASYLEELVLILEQAAQAINGNHEGQ